MLHNDQCTRTVPRVCKRVRNEWTDKIIQKQVSSIYIFIMQTLSRWQSVSRTEPLFFSVFGCRVIGGLVMVKGYTQRINTRQNTRFPRNAYAASYTWVPRISIISPFQCRTKKDISPVYWILCRKVTYSYRILFGKLSLFSSLLRVALLETSFLVQTISPSEIIMHLIRAMVLKVRTICWMFFKLVMRAINIYVIFHINLSS